MLKYEDYLPELKSTTLFQGIEEKTLIEFLKVMNPEIVIHKANSKSNLPIDMENGFFCVTLRGKPLNELAPRLDVYNMPQFSEPGMMMGEIPCLSEILKSKAPKMKSKGTGKKGASKKEHDLHLLLMSGEMLTKFYGPQFAIAQSKVLRNFLGILAQKVTDIRKEKSELASEYEKELAPYRLNIFSAGVAMKLVKEVEAKWNQLHPELPAVVTIGGSVDLIRFCLAKDPCDLLILADDALIKNMMMPEYAEGYRIWAGNKMVLMGEDINDQNWEEKLLEKSATFKHHDPYGDPSGYRAVMSILLADQYKKELSDRLMNHSGHIGMEKNTGPFGNLKDAKYEFAYYSGAKSSGKNFAQLPEIMDFSNPALAESYAKVSFDVDDTNKVIATPISHGLTVPLTALHKEEAKEFAKMFVAIDKTKHHFLPRDGFFGKDPLI